MLNQIFREREKVTVARHENQRIPAIAINRSEGMHREPDVDANLFYCWDLAAVDTMQGPRRLGMDL